MIQKISILGFTLFYLLLQVGINLHAHFCGDEQTATWLYVAPDAKCGCGDEDMQGNCCHEQLTVFKVKDAQLTANHISPKLASYQLIPACITSLPHAHHKPVEAPIHTCIEWPPPLHELPIFIQVQNFRI